MTLAIKIIFVWLLTLCIVYLFAKREFKKANLQWWAYKEYYFLGQLFAFMWTITVAVPIIAATIYVGVWFFKL